MPFSDAPEATASAEASEPDTTGHILAYAPRFVVGGSQHPGVIVETPGLANVEPPPITYRPHLPCELALDGKLSGMQLERII